MRLRVVLGLVLRTATALAVTAHAHTPAAPQVVVVGASDSAPYQAALTELTALARGTGIAVTAPDAFRQAQVEGRIGRADIYVALGARSVPMVLSAAQPGRALTCLTTERWADLPGVVLAHSAAVRIEFVRRVVPKARAIGVLFDPKAPGTDLAALEAAARAAQVVLVAKPVAEAADLEGQLDRLSNEVDVLLATYDLGLYSAKNAAQLIRFSYQHRIPLVGMSDSWTRAGALAGLDWDYRDLGAQCAAKALRMARGERVEQDVQRPRRAPYSINAATARQLRARVPAEVLQGARSVYE
jgi:ABC-type uncharacterized transport system substrate-binding protein